MEDEKILQEKMILSKKIWEILMAHFSEGKLKEVDLEEVNHIVDVFGVIFANFLFIFIDPDHYETVCDDLKRGVLEAVEEYKKKNLTKK